MKRNSPIKVAVLSGGAVALALVLFVAVLSEASLNGRLARHPRVDDVLYMSRGAELLLSARSGVGALLSSWSSHPPHSPWAAGISAIGAAIFGPHDWAPYVLTVLPVMFFLLVIVRTTKGVSFLSRVCLLVIAACAPFLAAGNQNLKPDYFCGILTAVGMSVALSGSVVRSRRRRPLKIGVCFGLALLVKPAMLVPTLMLLAGTLAICCCRDLVLADVGSRWRVLKSRLVGSTVTTAVAALVAAPHFSLALPSTVAYTLGVLRGGGGGDGPILAIQSVVVRIR